jgi:hypothetical protein
MSGDNSFNPWVSIWTSPRATVSKLAHDTPNRGLWWLAAIYGFSGLLNFFQSIFLGNKIGIFPIFFLALILSPIWGYVSFSVWSFAVSLTGKWLKGAATFKVVRMAYAWSCVPFIINVVLWLILATVFGQALFTNFHEGYPFTRGQVAFLFMILILRIAVGIWSLVIYLNALAEVQKFSVLRAIGNMLLAVVLVGLFFWLITFVFSFIFNV